MAVEKEKNKAHTKTARDFAVKKCTVICNFGLWKFFGKKMRPRFELGAHNYKINTFRWHCIIMIWIFVSIPLPKYGYLVTYFYKILLWYVKSTFDISRNSKRLFLSFCQLSRNIISFPHSSAPRISNFKNLFGN